MTAVQTHVSTEVETRRARPVVAFAAIGALVVAFQVYVLVSWLWTGPSPTTVGREAVPTYLQVGAIAFQAISVVAFLATVYFVLIRPWRRAGHITVDGIFLIACGLLYWQDPLANYQSGYYSFNSTYVNFGSWMQEFPGWLMPNMDQVPEPILTVGLMYFWAFYGSVTVGAKLMKRAGERWPQLGFYRLCAIAWLALFVFETSLELVAMALTANWAYPGTKGPTLFAGHYFQLPVIETALVAAAWTTWAAMRLFVNERGESIAESGIGTLAIGQRATSVVRLLAFAGFMNVTYFLIFNAPTTFLIAPNVGTFIDDIADRPYLTGYMCGWDTGLACPDPGLPLPKRDSAYVDVEGNLVRPD